MKKKILMVFSMTLLAAVLLYPAAVLSEISLEIT